MALASPASLTEVPWKLLAILVCPASLGILACASSPPAITSQARAQVDANAPPCTYAGDYDAAKQFVNGILVETRTRSKMIELGIDTNMSTLAKKRWESCGLFHGTERVRGTLEEACPTRDVPVSELEAIVFTTFVQCDDRRPD